MSISIIKKIIPSILYKKKNLNKIEGFLDEYDGESVKGWAKADFNEPVELYVNVDDEESQVTANEYRNDLRALNIGDCAFISKLDIKKLLENDSWPVSVCIKNKIDQKHLYGSPLVILKPELEYKITLSTDKIFKGWVRDKNNSNFKIKLNLMINNEKVDQIVANNANEIDGKSVACGFIVDRAKYGLKEVDKIKLVDDYCLNLEITENHNLITTNQLISSFTALRQALKLESLSYDAKKYIDELSPAIFSMLRNNDYIYDSSELEKAENLDGKNNIDNSVCVVIPVYSGVFETIQCINSVLTSKNEKNISLIVIDDFGPEDEIRSKVEDLWKIHNFTYIKNTKNLGFVSTANIGMDVSGSSDVILLNADTVVSDGWVDALFNAAYSEKNIGTVTPISNNASILSFPNICKYNDFPKHLKELDRINEICQEIDLGVIDIPTANGFCMYIKREVISQIGKFDEELWGSGYGEENDFSLRATECGWRNVATINAFVYHYGSISFAEKSLQLIRENSSKLSNKYPEYNESVADFIEKDPLVAHRNLLAYKLILEELDKQYSKVILLVTHDFGGGTKKATDELSTLLQENNVAVFMLHQVSHDYWELILDNNNVKIKFSYKEQYQFFIQCLKEFSVSLVHYHHIVQFDSVVKNIPIDLCVKYFVTLHDYYVVCPRLSLIDNSGKYCGEPVEEVCNSCIKTQGINSANRQHHSVFNSDISKWRLRSKEWLKNSSLVIVPNEDVKTRINNYFNNLKVEIIENIDAISYEQEFKVTNNGELIIIGVIGAIGAHKGLNLLKSLSDFILNKNLHVSIKIIGYTEDDDYFLNNKKIDITGPYRPSELYELIQDVDVIFFPGECPETYSYVLTEALTSRKKVVAFDIGAIAQRLRRYRAGALLPIGSGNDLIIKTIQELLSNEDESLPLVDSSLTIKNRLIELYEINNCGRIAVGL